MQPRTENNKIHNVRSNRNDNRKRKSKKKRKSTNNDFEQLAFKYHGEAKPKKKCVCCF